MRVRISDEESDREITGKRFENIAKTCATRDANAVRTDAVTIPTAVITTIAVFTERAAVITITTVV